MKYGKIVAKNEKAFGAVGFTKLVQDLAILLDSKEFAIASPDKWDHNTEELAKVREGVFNRFCAACITANVSLPPMEKEFYEVPLHRNNKTKLDEVVIAEQKRVKNHVSQQLAGKRSKSARQCRSLQTVMDLFPQSGFGRFDEEKMVAMMNVLLTGQGCDPIRPDYSKIKLNISQMLEPQNNAIILIVDDDKKVALKTATALAGWPGVSIKFHFYHCECSWKELKGDAKEKVLTTTAQDVLKRNAHIILMDQGLGDIKGSDLVMKIKESDTSPIIVGNTGGSDDELRAAGALRNCEKGSNLSGISQAIGMLG